ncbi:MAG: flagellar basal-body rod protein FlgG [Planctomycetota bacterium]
MRTAASGMLAQQTQVDTIANNIANVNTSSFKKNRVNFRSLLYHTMREPGATTAGSQMVPTGLQVGSGTEVSSSIKLMGQGDLEPTGSDFDIAIQGEGFFEIDLGNGEFRYTRDGAFRKDANGDLVTVDGFKLATNINIPPDAIEISIGQDGTVSVIQAGNPVPTATGQILLTRFANPSGLKATGQNLFSVTASSGAPQNGTAAQDGTGFIRHRFLERSNVFVVDELISLIQAQRNYEVNSRTIRVADEMLQQVSNLVR